MKSTPLAAEHRAAGAKLVEFAGWEMPLHYGSQIDEHHAVRRDAGVFDISHMLALDIEGPGARAFLRQLLANDVARLQQAGKALYSCMLAEDGGILDDLIVYYLDDGCYRAVLNAATAASDLAWMERLRTADVTLRPRHDLAMLAVQGPMAREKCWAALPGLRVASEALGVFFATPRAYTLDGEMFVARTGYTGEDGFELMMPAEHASATWRALLAAGVRACGLGARDTLRLEAGMNLYGQDMDAGVTPVECGLEWTLSMSADRAFVGKAALSARAPVCRMLGLVLEGRAGVLRSHQAIQSEHGAGSVTSGSFSPTLQASIALARLPRACQPGERVTVSIRDKALAARVVRPPFARHGEILV